MTVKELMKKLAKMDQNAQVVFPDTYAQNEGWGEGCENAVLHVDDVMIDKEGRVYLYEEEF